MVVTPRIDLCTFRGWEERMKAMRSILTAGLMTVVMSGNTFGQQDDRLGKLSFPTSCDPAVQAQFERGVAMIHSYWFLIARRTFEDVLQKDPNCAIAYWGIAADFLGNTLGHHSDPSGCPGGAGGTGKRARDQNHAARARLDRSVERLLPGLRQDPRQRQVGHL